MCCWLHISRRLGAVLGSLCRSGAVLSGLGGGGAVLPGLVAVGLVVDGGDAAVDVGVLLSLDSWGLLVVDFAGAVLVQEVETL